MYSLKPIIFSCLTVVKLICDRYHIIRICLRLQQMDWYWQTWSSTYLLHFRGVVAVIAVFVLAATIWDGFFRKAWLAKKFGISEPDFSDPAKIPDKNVDNYYNAYNGFAPQSNGISKHHEESLKRLSSLPTESEMVESGLTDSLGKFK